MRANAAGTVCGARDIGAIAAAMSTLLAAAARAARAGADALAALRPLTPDAMALRLIELYESLLPPHRHDALRPVERGQRGCLRILGADARAHRRPSSLAPRRNRARGAPIPMTGANLYSRLLRYVRPYRWAFGIAVLGMMIVAAGDLMLAWLVIPIVRNFESPDPLAPNGCRSTIVAVFLLRGVGAYISEFGMGWTGYRVVFDLRRDLIDKLLRLPTPYYDTHAAG